MSESESEEEGESESERKWGSCFNATSKNVCRMQKERELRLCTAGLGD